MGANLPVPNAHCNVLYRQTYNTLGAIVAAGLTQDNRVGNDQKVNNTRLTTTTNKGILAGSVVATAGSGTIGAAAGDSTTVFDKVVGIAVNDAVGNPYESSSAVGSGKVVYAHGSGTVISTDIYETKKADGTTPVAYVYGDKLYASQNGLIINEDGLTSKVSDTATKWANCTQIGILLKVPTASDLYMNFQMKL